jgi:hypothetical protein
MHNGHQKEISEALAPVTWTAFGIGNGDHQDNIVLFKKDHSIPKPCQHASPGALCVRMIDLWAGNDLLQSGSNFPEERVAATGLRLKYHSNASLISS